MKTLRLSPNTVYRMINPTWLSRFSIPVCFATGSMMMGKGMNSAASR
ncbi:Uncharacterised protein [Mycobacteroides abscessus subsp. abscessus]|nr:Uncharacterised protein [Mycobacteroides abscessus subsp. abscessus]